MSDFTHKELVEWCRIPYQELLDHPQRKIPFRLCRDSAEMGQVMARDLVDEIQARNARGLATRAIIPCGPMAWYQPFAEMVNRERVSLRDCEIFHMDECLDWQGRELPIHHPFSFRGTMQRVFYDPISPDLSVLEGNRRWLSASNVEEIAERLAAAPADIALGGWGQDGHLAYNQARRHPYSQITLADLRSSTVRIQENNLDTIMAISQRSLGGAYQFVPPMSVTLGLKEILAARKIRVFSDTGAWKQTALRVALFGPLTAEYPMTLLQEHPDALVTATVATAIHPISEHPEWDLGV